MDKQQIKANARRKGAPGAPGVVLGQTAQEEAQQREIAEMQRRMLEDRLIQALSNPNKATLYSGPLVTNVLVDTASNKRLLQVAFITGERVDIELTQDAATATATQLMSQTFTEEAPNGETSEAA